MKSFSDLKSALKADFHQIIAQKVLKYANSYHLESRKPFNIEKVENEIQNVIKSEVTDETKYDTFESPKLALKLSTEIRERVRGLDFDRYKLVCMVQISEKAGQGLLTISQALWDENRDCSAMATFENYYLTVSAIVYGIYYE